MGHHQAQRAASTMPGCQPNQATLWFPSEACTPGRPQEDDAVVFCQSPSSATSHLLTPAILPSSCVILASLLEHARRIGNAICQCFAYRARLASLARSAFLAYLGNVSRFERACPRTRWFPFLTPTETGAKMLKCKGFDALPEWSKTCSFNATCFHIPQDTRT